MSNSQQGYKWMKSFVFLEARNGEKARARSFSSKPQLATGAEFEMNLKCLAHLTEEEQKATVNSLVDSYQLPVVYSNLCISKLYY